jgi:hypothetical protein
VSEDEELALRELIDWAEGFIVAVGPIDQVPILRCKDALKKAIQCAKETFDV